MASELMRDIPDGERALKVPAGGPRVHWLEASEAVPDIDLVPPADRLMVIESVSVRTSADGNGDVWVVYAMVMSE